MICNMSSPEEVRLLLDDTVAGNTAKVAVLLMMEQRLGHVGLICLIPLLAAFGCSKRFLHVPCKEIWGENISDV